MNFLDFLATKPKITAVKSLPDWMCDAVRRVGHREKSRGVDVAPSISPHDVLQMFHAQCGKCANCSVAFVVTQGFRFRNAPIIDRLDTLQPTYNANFQILCYWCNTAKGGYDCLEQIRDERHRGIRLPHSATCVTCDRRLPNNEFYRHKLSLSVECIRCKSMPNLSLDTIRVRAEAMRRYTTKKHAHSEIYTHIMWHTQDGACGACGCKLSLIHRAQNSAHVDPETYAQLLCFKCTPKTYIWKSVHLEPDEEEAPDQ